MNVFFEIIKSFMPYWLKKTETAREIPYKHDLPCTKSAHHLNFCSLKRTIYLLAVNSINDSLYKNE